MDNLLNKAGYRELTNRKQFAAEAGRLSDPVNGMEKLSVIIAADEMSSFTEFILMIKWYGTEKNRNAEIIRIFPHKYMKG